MYFYCFSKVLYLLERATECAVMVPAINLPLNKLNELNQTSYEISLICTQDFRAKNLKAAIILVFLC